MKINEGVQQSEKLQSGQFHNFEDVSRTVKTSQTGKNVLNMPNILL